MFDDEKHLKQDFFFWVKCVYIMKLTVQQTQLSLVSDAACVQSEPYKGRMEQRCPPSPPSSLWFLALTLIWSGSALPGHSPHGSLCLHSINTQTRARMHGPSPVLYTLIQATHTHIDTFLSLMSSGSIQRDRRQ